MKKVNVPAKGTQRIPPPVHDQDMTEDTRGRYLCMNQAVTPHWSLGLPCFDVEPQN